MKKQKLKILKRKKMIKQILFKYKVKNYKYNKMMIKKMHFKLKVKNNKFNKMMHKLIKITMIMMKNMKKKLKMFDKLIYKFYIYEY